jgi:hypothetical protein
LASARSSGRSAKRTITSARRAIDLLDRNARRDDQQLVGAGVVDHVRLSRADVRAALGLEVVRLAVQLERARAGSGVEKLVTLRLPRGSERPGA